MGTSIDSKVGTSATPGLIHVTHNGNGATPNSSNPNSGPNQIPKTKVKHLLQQQPMRLDNIVSTLFDMKSFINNPHKVLEFERLIDLILCRFNEMQTEKFNLLQEINILEKENDKLYEQTRKINNNDIDNDGDDEDNDEFK